MAPDRNAAQVILSDLKLWILIYLDIPRSDQPTLLINLVDIFRFYSRSFRMIKNVVKIKNLLKFVTI
ncbi:MAG TPA: hypothetical protein VK250_11210 [Nitrososphaeraceae archaeon]|nr:hypothetical protein [Nitrososphaeraceae archaeon]